MFERSVSICRKAVKHCLILMERRNEMKHKLKVIVAGIGVSLMLFVGVVSAFNYDALQKYFSKDEETIQNDIKAMSTEKLISEMNMLSPVLADANEVDSLIPFAAELRRRKDVIQNSDIIKELKKNTNLQLTKEILVDLYADKNANQPNQDDLKQLLQDESIDNRLKTKIVNVAQFNSNDIKILKKFIEGQDAGLAFASLKQLSRIDLEEADKNSNQILLNYKTEPAEKVSAALKAKSKYLVTKKSKGDFEAQAKEFLQLGFDIITTSNDAKLRDAAFFAISDLRIKESITNILKNNLIDRELKVYAVDQHFEVLNEMLINQPTEEEIETVVEAMELLPISDLIVPLEEASKRIENADLKQRCEEVLAFMKTNGVSGNKKWSDGVK